MVRERAGMVHAIAGALAELDVFTALAELAMRHDYSRPLMDASRNFRYRRPDAIRLWKLPCAARPGTAFVPNDCILSAGEMDEDGEPSRHIKLITGPNMAGKSTYLGRMQSLHCWPRPAVSCRRSRRISAWWTVFFSRVGAADDLARGRSTFMVEMVETATILNLATDRSLVILDEIGRGTATYDGLSIAWACVEHLHMVNRCRALFATHFHELTALASRLDTGHQCHGQSARMARRGYLSA